MQSEPRIPYPRQTEPPKVVLPFARMTRYVFERVKVHPNLEPLRQAKVRYLVHAHAEAIWIAAVPNVASSNYLIESRIERPEWWKPSTMANGDAIVAELVAGVLTRWEAWKATSGRPRAGTLTVTDWWLSDGR